MNALTILLKVQGSCHIIGQQFHLNFDDENLVLYKNQTQFSVTKKLPVTNGWNKICFTHIEHNDDLTLVDKDKNIIDFSYVSFDHISLNDYTISHTMWQNSGGKSFNPITNKQLHLYRLGEPFCLEINYYFPLEYWTFALAKSNSNYGKIGWE